MKKTFAERESEYNAQHQHPANIFCHAIGIPLIIASILAIPFHWRTALALFAVGWTFQFVGHMFEGKKPSFVDDPRFLIVGPIAMARKLIKRPSR